MVSVVVVLGILAAIVLVILLAASVRIIQPYEQALYIFLGKYRGKLNTGVSLVIPLGSRVVRMDMRTQVLEVPRQEVITKDNSSTNVDAIIYTKVIDAERATFEVSDFRFATVALAQTTLRSVIGDMELDEVLNSREKINARLRDLLDEATDAWGVRVEAVEIREVDPVERVKRAMEEQTSAERERRAAILKADGQKRAAVLEAEGLKRARILQAEGVRQSKILEAEGDRTAQILTSQGRAQALRVLALGSAPLDSKALSVLSLDALGELGRGQATKIVLPFEVTRALQGIASHLGIAPDAPTGKRADLKELEAMVGRSSDVLGELPSHAAIKAELDALSREMEQDQQDAEDLVDKKKARVRGKGKAAAAGAADASDAPAA
ncbi:MAG TPA: SPFH domain-containing protein [Candidatus Thermoplasmatota archaeon]|nr:SPFH domain-containing protein [Candidatus Thermoplasmatota archaeon]